MNNLLKNRNTPRILRLAGGIGLGIYAVAAHEPLLWILAGFFLLQALLNVSCCGRRENGQRGVPRSNKTI